MPKLTRTERLATAKTRIHNVLNAQTVVNLRTLEQKISDAGPYNQRVQPHVLTQAKNKLLKEGVLSQKQIGNAQWLHLSDAAPEQVNSKLATLHDIWHQFTNPSVSRRTGQALEIAIYRSLLAAEAVTPINGFVDLELHDDSALYSKREVHSLNGNNLGNRALDFVALVGGKFVGIEAKNVRPWLYPHDEEVRDALQKALALKVIPVLIARRIPYVTFRLLGTCGVLMHETYNQRMANADAQIANLARNKNLLGYHDIRVGNLPDQRLTRFVSEHLPSLIDGARSKLDEYEDLLFSFANGQFDYSEFAARVRRRESGTNEDHDWEDEASY